VEVIASVMHSFTVSVSKKPYMDITRAQEIHKECLSALLLFIMKTH